MSEYGKDKGIVGHKVMEAEWVVRQQCAKGTCHFGRCRCCHVVEICQIQG